MPFLQLPDGRQVPVAGDNFIIGSDADCSLCLREAGVTPRQVILQRDGEVWRLATLNLQANTRLNGERVENLETLQDGDSLQLGEAMLTWGAGEAAAPPPVQRIPTWIPVAVILAACLGIVAIALFWNNSNQTEVAGLPFEDIRSVEGSMASYGDIDVSAPVYVVTMTLEKPLAWAPEKGPPPDAIATITPQISAPVYRVKIFGVPEDEISGEAVGIQPTLEATATAVPPSPTPTRTPGPRSTPIVLFSDVRGTATAEALLTPSVETQTATGTPAPLVIESIGGAQRSSGVSSSVQCIPPQGWRPVRIKQDETLSMIASRAETTVRNLVRANCLQGEDVVPGQQIYIPKQ